MGLAEEIASKIPKRKGHEDEDKDQEVQKINPGDRGKAILAAIKQSDAVALEELLTSE